MGILKKLLFLPPIALAVVLFMMSGKSAKPPRAASDKQEKATPVKVIGAKSITVTPSVSGYGRVQPARAWEAVAEVAGPVVWTAENLRDGLLIGQGTELLRIDTREYELGLAQLDAEREALDARDRTNEASLRIEQRALDLLKEDLSRKQTLLKQGSTSQAMVDAAERAMLTAEAKVQTLLSNIKLNEAERNVLKQKREIAALNVERTVIKAPFDLRLGTVDIALGQYVNKGEKLFSGDGIAVAEVVAQFPVGALSPLLGKTGTPGAALGTLADDKKAVSDRHALLKAKVRLNTPKTTVEWDAVVDRVTATMDPKTRTRGIVLKIEDPYGQATPGQRPPLVRDMAVEVVLIGPPRKGMIALPALAVRKSKVMIVDDEKRLRFISAKPAYIQGNIIVLKSGVEPKQKVIVSDMPSPVEGMLLKPRPDKALLARVIAEATGKSQSKSKGM
ncbi:hypothetical protein SAMN04515647_0346 [Cohaesibacter sp. ES.047]|uniref:efflux RND transporter periplasmic adaptor subunit n=1 Tax=Cohaesibacter sp. ES.047 TaxID=1798205 RepID=UPI000BB81675|nr:hypothetical protein [Cohaesibacter sp. ES.047]SNY90199.1 hypothetical protein SAMN04515647_0346 [Cohaesibacter sp. ES.047]